MAEAEIVSDTTIGRLRTKPQGWRRVAWQGGAFETAYRPRTALVEGAIQSGSHLVMVTLRGGATDHETAADGGHRYKGADRAGFVSFLPAGCERRLVLRDVAWQWASIALDPTVSAGADGKAAAALDRLAPFSAVQDGFVLALLAELERLNALDGGLDPLYCETMAEALSRYLRKRFVDARSGPVPGPAKLPAWRLRRVEDYIDAHLGGRLRIGDLAMLCGLSERHFHRAFSATTGRTPLAFIQERRVRAAAAALARDDVSVAALALEVGFLSPSHFARVFRSVLGLSPSEYRLRIGL
jgi:AraC family transcriptional regulator